MREVEVSLFVTSDNPEVVARAAELFGRAAAGLAMDGAEVMLIIGEDYDEAEAEDVDTEVTDG